MQFSPILNDEKEAYAQNLPNMIVKKGQRKLFFSLLNFMKMIDEKLPIIYIGASPGHNIALIAKWYPDHHFRLYDTREFDAKLYKLSNVQIFREYYTLEHAALEEPCYFISDIRVGTDNFCLESIAVDMELQAEIVKIIKPKLTMLKFRLPWTAGQTEYFDGDIYPQTRTGKSSTETRLIFSEIRMKNYDHDDYNNRMYFHNKYTRHHQYITKRSFYRFNDLCDCWDCVLEMNLVTPKEMIEVNKYFPLKSLNPAHKLRADQFHQK